MGAQGRAGDRVLAGLLQFVTGGFYVVHPLQLLLDYFIAPTAAGIGGFLPDRSEMLHLRNKRKDHFLCYAGRPSWKRTEISRTCHQRRCLFGNYAPKGTPVWIYSLVYNGTYMLPSFIVCTIVLCILLLTAPRLLENRTNMR